jgi:transcriptional regulator with XRE-family HTH domain
MKKRKAKSRLALVREEMGITQRVLADRAGLSLVYLKELEYGYKHMSKSAALALSVATGVALRWLMGEGRLKPIPAGMLDSGENWTRDTADNRVGLKRNRSEYHTFQDASDITVMLLFNFHLMAEIVSSTFKSRNRQHAFTAMKRIEWELRELRKQFRVSLRPFPQKMGSAFNRAARNYTLAKVANRLGDDLQAELDKCPNELRRKAKRNKYRELRHDSRLTVKK